MIARLAKRAPLPPARARTRLLTVGPVPPEWGGRLRGGVTRFTATLLDEMRSRPWRHRIEPLGVLIPPPHRVRRRVADERSPLPIFQQPKGGRPRRFTSILLDQQRPDVVLLNNLAAFNGARYARVQAQVAPELPIVAVVHEWRAIRTKEGERLERFRENAQSALDSVAAVVFPSEHTRKQGIDELGLSYPERAPVIPNPVQPIFADPSQDISGPREGVAFVGSFNPRKNPESLVRAAALDPGMRLTMQGRGPEKERIEALVAELGMGDRVSFPPFSGKRRHVRDVAEIMRSAELLCLPSFSESFALVIVEALAVGTPVAGFGPTLVEIQERLGIEIGEPIFDPTPENISTAIESVRTRSWDHEGLRKATLAEFSTPAVTRRYSRLLRSVGREH